MSEAEGVDPGANPNAHAKAHANAENTTTQRSQQSSGSHVIDPNEDPVLLAMLGNTGCQGGGDRILYDTDPSKPPSTLTREAGGSTTTNTNNGSETASTKPEHQISLPSQGAATTAAADATDASGTTATEDGDAFQQNTNMQYDNHVGMSI
ncbi:hypothetical protein IAT40_007212 [Kwoniella sp. CBS 6097]